MISIILYGVIFLLIALMILFVMYLTIMKYHEHLKEIINTQSSQLRILTNLATSKNLEAFSTLQTLTSNPSQVTPSNFDTNLIDPESIVEEFKRSYSQSDGGVDFNTEFGGL